MRIVADENIPFVADAFRGLGEVTTLPTPQITSTAVHEAELLVIRYETRVNEALLSGSPVRFVASATIGTDHVDLAYLQARGISFASAPGCNSNSVKEYIVAALLSFAVRHRISLQGKKLGVVGVGNIGSKVVKAAQALGMTVLENDPPLARTTGDPRFVELEKLLDADFITLHTPLTRTGPDPTYHLINQEKLSRMKEGMVLLNASRGAVVDTGALKHALLTGKLSAALLDVWEDEPTIDCELLSQAALGTAHIAGYSMEGKLNAVRMVREAVCQYFGLTVEWNPARNLRTPVAAEILLDTQEQRMEFALHNALQQAYRIEEDDARLREMLKLPADRRSAYFASLRSRYTFRREFSNYTVHFSPGCESFMQRLSILGFHCVPDCPSAPP